MAELPPDIMSMLSRGGNLPDEDEFEDFMDQASSLPHTSSSYCSTKLLP